MGGLSEHEPLPQICEVFTTISSACCGSCARSLPTLLPWFWVLDASVPLPCWSPFCILWSLHSLVSSFSGLCILWSLHSLVSPFSGPSLCPSHGWLTSGVRFLIYLRWVQRACSAQMLFGHCRVAEVVNHITAVSLSRKHSRGFLSRVFCTGNFRQTPHRALSLQLGSGFGPPPAGLWLFPVPPLCSGAKQEYLFLHHHFQRNFHHSVVYFPPFLAHWKALGD